MADISTVRQRAMDLVKGYTAGPVEGAQQEILVDGGWDERVEPSGDFCHWFLWKLGCRDSRILSRNVPEASIRREGHPARRLLEGAQRLGAWRPFQLDASPLPGDIILTGERRKGEQERARVVLAADDSRRWFAVEVWLDSANKLRMSEFPFEVRGEELVRSGMRETLVGWVNLLSALGSSD